MAGHQVCVFFHQKEPLWGSTSTTNLQQVDRYLTNEYFIWTYHSLSSLRQQCFRTNLPSLFLIARPVFEVTLFERFFSSYASCLWCIFSPPRKLDTHTHLMRSTNLHLKQIRQETCKNVDNNNLIFSGWRERTFSFTASCWRWCFHLYRYCISFLFRWKDNYLVCVGN